MVVDIEWSGISTGTERLLWTGRMPAFPGMGYPLVPGYESVGRVTQAGAAVRAARRRPRVRAGRQLLRRRARPVRRRGVARRAAGRAHRRDRRAASASRACCSRSPPPPTTSPAARRATQPDLIVGHGVLGRLLARIAVAPAPSPVVWETNAARRDGAVGYEVVDPAPTPRRDYRCICDVSGDAALLDTLIARLAPGGEVVLAGFYDEPLSFAFAPAFMREARLRVAAQWQPADLLAVRDLVESGALSLDGLITHRQTRARRRRLPHRVRRPRLSEDDPRLENAANERRLPRRSGTPVTLHD